MRYSDFEPARGGNSQKITPRSVSGNILNISDPHTIKVAQPPTSQTWRPWSRQLHLEISIFDWLEVDETTTARTLSLPNIKAVSECLSNPLRIWSPRPREPNRGHWHYENLFKLIHKSVSPHPMYLICSYIIEDSSITDSSI